MSDVREELHCLHTRTDAGLGNLLAYMKLKFP